MLRHCDIILECKTLLLMSVGNLDFEKIEEQAEGIFGGR